MIGGLADCKWEGFGYGVGHMVIVSQVCTLVTLLKHAGFVTLFWVGNGPLQPGHAQTRSLTLCYYWPVVIFVLWNICATGAIKGMYLWNHLKLTHRTPSFHRLVWIPLTCAMGNRHEICNNINTACKSIAISWLMPEIEVKQHKLWFDK
jgi:hypothetical protein